VPSTAPSLPPDTEPAPDADREEAAALPDHERSERPPPPAVEPGRLAIDFDHHLKTGTLRVWVDDELVLDDRIDAGVEKKVVLFKVRKGSYKEVLDVPAGTHRVRVQLRWDDHQRTESIEGAFRPGTTSRLDVTLGRLRKNLSLEWK
jgi:hypothetical protein